MSAPGLSVVRPSLPGQWREARLLRRYDAVAILTIFLGLVFLLPARLVVGPLGAAGRPSVLFATGLGLLWALALLQRQGVDARRQPVRWIAALFLCTELLTYAVGWDRGLSEAESTGADRWMLVTLAMVGLALFVADGVADRGRLDDLLRRATWGAAAMGVIGALQFLFGLDLTRYLRLPGLRLNQELIGIGERGDGFARVASTATHYIEFGVLLAMMLPIAIHYASFSRDRRQRIRRWLLVAIIASSVPFSVSRSGTLAIAVAVVFIAVPWPWRLRYNAIVIAGISVVAFRLVQPGLLGTIRSLFTNVENDPSIQGRTEDYAVVGAFFRERPWLGRGAGTFLPDQYTLLDNQFLLTLVSGGLAGLSAFVLVFMGCYWLGRSVRLRGSNEETRHLGQVLAASIVVGLASSATFDSFSFTSFTCMTFFLLGAAGALYRLDRGAERRPLQPASPGDRFVATPWMAARQ